MSKKRIEEQWTNYSTVALPPDAPEEEVSACKRAFFAGANLGIAVIIDDSTDPEEVVRDVKAEFAAFLEESKQ